MISAMLPRLLIKFDPFEGAGFGVVNAISRFAEQTEQFTRIEHESAVDDFVMVLMRVAEERGVTLRRGREADGVFLVMRESEFVASRIHESEFAVMRDVGRGIAGDLEREEPVAVVVAKNRVDRAGEFSQLARDERRDKIAAMNNHRHAARLELPERMAEIRKVIVGIGDDADEHGSPPIKRRNEDSIFTTETQRGYCNEYGHDNCWHRQVEVETDRDSWKHSMARLELEGLHASSLDSHYGLSGHPVQFDRMLYDGGPDSRQSHTQGLATAQR